MPMIPSTMDLVNNFWWIVGSFKGVKQTGLAVQTEFALVNQFTDSLQEPYLIYCF